MPVPQNIFNLTYVSKWGLPVAVESSQSYTANLTWVGKKGVFLGAYYTTGAYVTSSTSYPPGLIPQNLFVSLNRFGVVNRFEISGSYGSLNMNYINVNGIVLAYPYYSGGVSTTPIYPSGSVRQDAFSNVNSIGVVNRFETSTYFGSANMGFGNMRGVLLAYPYNTSSTSITESISYEFNQLTNVGKRGVVNYQTSSVLVDLNKKDFAYVKTGVYPGYVRTITIGGREYVYYVLYD